MVFTGVQDESDWHAGFRHMRWSQVSERIPSNEHLSRTPGDHGPGGKALWSCMRKYARY